MDRALQEKFHVLLQMIRSNRLLVSLLAAFLVSAGITAYLTFLTVRAAVATWNLGDLPSFALQRGPGSQPGGAVDVNTPLQPATGPTPEPWDGTARVTVLVMGLDSREWETDQGPPRTDTLIVFTLDPVSRSAGMLSIPRDLWVDIPGFQSNKINTAYRLGETHRLPGGGPGLAIQTVEQLLGVPVQFYALIDFSAFVRFIDEIGGAEIEVLQPIRVDPLGPDNTVTLGPGVHTLTGEVALAYARARDTEGGDFDRSDRQQQVALAIRRQILSLDMLPTLISKAPRIYQEVAGGVQTNLSLEQMVKIAALAAQIPDGNIRREIIGANHVLFQTSLDGQDILVPIPEEIRRLRDRVFASEITDGPIAIATDPAELVATEGARISVLNGTFTVGLAARTSEYLRGRGVEVAVIGNADQFYDETTVIDYTGKPYTVQYLVAVLNISPDRIFNRFDPDSEVDVEVALGNDWAANNPMR